MIELGQIVVDRTPQTLAPVRVRATRISPELPGTGPGTQRAFLGPEFFADHLAEISSIEAIAALVPGLDVSEAELGGVRLSVPGVGAAHNSVTLDGSRYAGLIPRDAVAAATVSTSADASRGRFAGAEVAAHTARGYSVPLLSLRSVLYAPQAASSLANGSIVRDPSPFTLAVTASGPLERDGWRFFTTAELGRRPAGIATWRLGGARGSEPAGEAAAMIDALRLLGVPGTAHLRTGTTFATGLINLTRPLGFTTSRSLRVNGYSVIAQQVPESGLSTAAWTVKQLGGQLHAGFTHAIRARVLNESRLALSHDSRAQQPLLDLPRGDAAVTREDGSVAAVSFGGSGLGPQLRTTNAVEAATAFTWEQSVHRFRLGVDARTEGLARFDAAEAPGRFSFSSVSAVASNQPVAFGRNLPATGHARQSDLNLFANNLWNVRDGLRLQTGLRWEAATLTGAGMDARTTVESAATRRQLTEAVLLPRAAATWRYGGGTAGKPLGEVRFSAGGYRGLLPAELVRQVAGGGHPGRISCSGTGVPQPQWIAGAAHDCAGSTSLLQESFLLSPDFRAPTSWRGIVEMSLPTGTRAALTLRGMLTVTTGLPAVVDVNARNEPLFRLADENLRPVYVRPTDIDPEAAIPDIGSSRIDPALGVVAEHRSDLRARTRQATAELWLPPAVRGGGRWRASYTYTSAREERHRSDLADDPRMRLSVTAATERAHQIHILGAAPRNRFADINVLATIFAGAPFTPLVRTDIDGDGFSDDPAFVFAAGSADTAAAAAVWSLQASSSGFVRRCLGANMGRVAATNSCRGPWSGRVDIIARLRGAALGGARRATIELRATNVLGGLDRLLHGAEGLRGWSPGGFVDPVLWIPRGFDAANQRYSYALNSNFGRIASPLNPFRLSVDVRIPLGPNPQKAQLLQLMGRGPGQTQPASARQLEQILAQLLPNPMHLALQRRDSLGLTVEQVARLEAIDAAYQLEVASVLQPLAAELVQLSTPLVSQDVVQRVNAAFDDLHRRQMRWGDEIHDILSPSQRQRLPLYVQHILYDSDDDVEPVLR